MHAIGDSVSRRALLSSALAAGAFSERVHAAQGRSPNIVFILADDLGAFDLSCYGRPDYRTPHIDSLARNGVKFRLGYANSSTCAPTRTALISGRYQNRFPIGSGEGGGYPSDTIGYSGDWPSLPKTLRRAGYRTALIGKWGLGELPAFSPNKSGYDEFFGLMGGGFDYFTHDTQILTAERRPDLYENETPISLQGYATDLFTDRACAFIDQNAHRSFLLSLHYTAPHWPWQTRTDPGEPRRTDYHAEGGSPAIYAQMMQALDEGVGRVLRTLRRNGLTRDTIVIFTSDNGGERFSMMWPLRGEKGDLWEGGTRVPLLACWPGRIPRGAESDQVVMSMDFLPTLAALAGTSLEEASDGADISAQLFGSAPVARTVFWKAPRDQLSALAYPWKYLRVGPHEHLYNIQEDPTEHANLKRRETLRFAHLKAQAEAWSAQMLPTLPGLPDIIPALEALDLPANTER
ncbi:MAG TPA: sulfatase-like hydrolase/transferase [Terricaulis sp.]|nr:sulfatase-like hydrolase/transferase [Terricaulis sp.]